MKFYAAAYFYTMEDYTGFIDQALQSFDTDDICDPTWLASVTADIDNYVEMIYSHDGNLQVENSTNESVIALSTISIVLDIPPYTPATNPSSGIEAAQKLLDISAASAPPTLAMSNIFTTFQAAPGAVIAPSSAMIGESISDSIPCSATTRVTSELTATSAPGGHQSCQQSNQALIDKDFGPFSGTCPRARMLLQSFATIDKGLI
ncbi:hypothetical protein PtrM4_105540 [Pyrenophora tritici-repentis]|uniref:Uncharacterized protein n=1 Tax=Pyrenophora tritici-repentis TaxID=45151 RepID=A0A834RVM2_9PLEO|nr:hypothetical protein PtrM4_105540 [Pyrenophora tritici-repentis]